MKTFAYLLSRTSLRFVACLSGGLLIVGGMSSIAQARLITVPVIDPAAAQSAVMLLIGSALVVTSKWKKR